MDTGTLVVEMPAAKVRLDLLPANGTLRHRLRPHRCCYPRRPLSPATKGRGCAARGFSSPRRCGLGSSGRGGRSRRVSRSPLARCFSFHANTTIRVFARSAGAAYRWKCCYGRLWGHRGAVVGIAPSLSTTPHRRSERRYTGGRLLTGRRPFGNLKRGRRRCQRCPGRGLRRSWPVSGRCSRPRVDSQPAALCVQMLAAELDNYLHTGKRIAWLYGVVAVRACITAQDCWSSQQRARLPPEGGTGRRGSAYVHMAGGHLQIVVPVRVVYVHMAGGHLQVVVACTSSLQTIHLTNIYYIHTNSLCCYCCLKQGNYAWTPTCRGMATAARSGQDPTRVCMYVHTHAAALRYVVSCQRYAMRRNWLPTYGVLHIYSKSHPFPAYRTLAKSRHSVRLWTAAPATTAVVVELRLLSRAAG